jgi:hypothetical protein
LDRFESQRGDGCRNEKLEVTRKNLEEAERADALMFDVRYSMFNFFQPQFVSSRQIARLFIAT